MTALWSFDEQPRTGDPLRPGAAPAEIRDALLQRGPGRFASIARRAAERLTGEPVPAGEPLAQARRHVGL